MRRVAVCLSAIAVAMLSTSSIAAEEAGKTATAPEFIGMDEIRVPVVDGDRIGTTLRLKIVLRAKDAEAAAAITTDLPAIRSAALGTALDFGRLYASAMTPVDAGLLSARLSGAIGGLEPRIEKVLLIEVAATGA